MQDQNFVWWLINSSTISTWPKIIVLDLDSMMRFVQKHLVFQTSSAKFTFRHSWLAVSVFSCLSREYESDWNKAGYFLCIPGYSFCQTFLGWDWRRKRSEVIMRAFFPALCIEYIMTCMSSSIFRHASVSSTYPSKMSVRPLVILLNFHSISVSGCSTWKVEERGPQLFFNFGSG